MKNDIEIRCLENGTYIYNGRYMVECVIGTGGFGVTYAAWDNMLQMRVAIKEYLPGEFSTRAPGNITVSIYGGEKEEQYKDGLAKFYDESRRLAQFQGVPGIVQVFDVFMENETAYIVMEYLDGETLGERLKRDEKLPDKEAVKIMLPILQALEAVHKEGILHRDIAPNNIFLCNNGEVKLLDFGAARSATGTHSKSLTVLYKEGYTAEEQYRSRGDQGSWTDVYACAATLYKMLTGNIPQGAMERRRKDMLKAPSKCGAKIPVNVERAIMNALNLEIKDRTQTAGQFMEELLSAKSVKYRFKKVKNKKRDRVPFWIWGISSVAIICVGIFIWMIFDGRFAFVDGFTNLFAEEGMVRVPNIQNMTKEDAKKRLEKLNLSLRVKDYEYNKLIEEDMILSQMQEKGSLVDSGSIIYVTASKGYGKVRVPDFIGLTKEEAEKVASENKIDISFFYSWNGDADVDEELVTSQSSFARTFIPENKKIEIGIGLSTERYCKELLDVFNETRRKNGLSDLEISNTLSDYLEIYRLETMVPSYMVSSFWAITQDEKSIDKKLEHSVSLTNEVLNPQYNYIGIGINEHDGFLWFGFSENK